MHRWSWGTLVTDDEVPLRPGDSAREAFTSQDLGFVCLKSYYSWNSPPWGHEAQVSAWREPPGAPWGIAQSERPAS